MVTISKGIGIMIRQVAMEFIRQNKEVDTLETGKMISNTDRVKRHGVMAVLILENTTTVKNTEKESTNMQTEGSMMDSGKQII